MPSEQQAFREIGQRSAELKLSLGGVVSLAPTLVVACFVRQPLERQQHRNSEITSRPLKNPPLDVGGRI
jgi:hypothetical protein